MKVEELKKILTDLENESNKKQLEEFKSMMKDELAELAKAVDKKVVVGQDEPDKNPWGLLSEFAKAVAVAEISHGRTVDKRLIPAEKAAGTPSLSEEGTEGYLIPTEFRTELLQLTEKENEILKRCMPIPMATNAVEIPYIAGFDESGGLVCGGIEWKWLDEKAQKEATKPEFGKIQLRLKKVAGLAYSSDELLEDSPISMENILKQGFAKGLNFQLNNVFLRGSGAGQPLGILNAPCLVTISQETGQAANTILFENIINMFARFYADTGGIWMANRNILPQLVTMNMAVGTGGVPVYMPANGIAGVPYNSLFGLPIVWNKHCSMLGTVGDIVLCDWSQYLVGQKKGTGAGVQFDTSIHLKFDYDQKTFRLTFRVDGQPWWPSALTPPQATETLSPFVVIETRSG